MGHLEILLGALTGMVVGLTGVGGGALITPIMLLVLGVAPPMAVGTGLWFAALTKLPAIHLFHRKGVIDWYVARLLWMGSLPASAATIYLLRHGLLRMGGPHFLNKFVAVAVLLTALGLLAHRGLQNPSPSPDLCEQDRPGVNQQILTMLAGAILGSLVTFTSVGAGALGAVALAHLYPKRLTAVRLVATDLVHAVPLAVCAGLGHYAAGHVDGGLLARLLMGSIPSVLAGAWLATWIPQAWLKRTLALVLATAGGHLLLVTH